VPSQLHAFAIIKSMNTPFVLAFDTASPVCAVAVVAMDEATHVTRIATRVSHVPNAHSSVLLPFARACLDELGGSPSAIRAIAVGIGPGSFTGVRIGVSVAQGLATGLGCPIYPIDSLMIFAESAYLLTGQSDVVVAVDSRMQSAYAARYQWVDDDWLTVAAPAQVPRDPWPPPLCGALLGVGNAFAVDEGLADCATTVLADVALSPAALAHLASRQVRKNAGIAAHDLRPNYVREKVAATIAERRAALAS
jgi:tRNA threonylcarbamoyladenosine biosynthesis protein TsaB